MVVLRVGRRRQGVGSHCDLVTISKTKLDGMLSRAVSRGASMLLLLICTAGHEVVELRFNERWSAQACVCRLSFCDNERLVASLYPYSRRRVYPYGSENRDDRFSFTGETCGYEFRSGESKQPRPIPLHFSGPAGRCHRGADFALGAAIRTGYEGKVKPTTNSGQ